MSTRSIRPLRTCAAALLAPLLLASLTGCLPDTEPFQVTLHNRTEHRVAAKVLATNPPQTLGSKSIRPGDSATLGPFPAPAKGRLELKVEPRDSIDSPIHQRLTPGAHSWDILVPMFRAKGTLELRERQPEMHEWIPARAMPNPHE